MEISSNQGGIGYHKRGKFGGISIFSGSQRDACKIWLESLKVRAIAARSYAVRCFKSRLLKSGRHADDSVSSQMYNNIEENPIAIQAVEETQV